MDTEKRVAETIRLIAAWTGENQVALASHLGVSQPSVSRAFRGTVTWRLFDLVCQHWGLTGAELLSGFGTLESGHRLPYRVRDAVKQGQTLTAARHLEAPRTAR
ncbi:hypothetical protein [Kitasatospora sp. MBT63]|uniref:hypothetical protein n=1 Tax=Kitasatospora sp. MBT63 TaxID=1444768 RepID=UPI00068CB3A4|nr:hypothetical protein [Kitasatospora sp. MBT63]